MIDIQTDPINIFPPNEYIEYISFKLQPASLSSEGNAWIKFLLIFLSCDNLPLQGR